MRRRPPTQSLTSELTKMRTRLKRPTEDLKVLKRSNPEIKDQFKIIHDEEAMIKNYGSAEEAKRLQRYKNKKKISGMMKERKIKKDSTNCKEEHDNFELGVKGKKLVPGSLTFLRKTKFETQKDSRIRNDLKITCQRATPSKSVMEHRSQMLELINKSKNPDLDIEDIKRTTAALRKLDRMYFSPTRSETNVSVSFSSNDDYD